MELNEQQRRALTQGLVDAGQGRDRARLIVDVAAKAAHDALQKMADGCQLAPDGPGALAALQIAVQLVRSDAEAMFNGMLELAGQRGAPTSTVALER